METEFQNAVGKSAGEVMRDIADFLAYPCPINPQKNIDLRTMLPDLNMPEQFTFALLSEAVTQGWSLDRAEIFYRRACSDTVDEETIRSMLHAFHDSDSEEYRAYQKKYGCYFTMLDGSYWASCLALGIDADKVDEVMAYLRLFTIALMEFAYMGDNNPSTTYTWSYYESFRNMLDELIRDPDPEPLPLKVRALGGSAGVREGDAYHLSLGVDIENPNLDRMARNVVIDVTLKDKDGNIITTVGDRVECIDPSVVYHYGVTKKIRGAAVASIAVTAKAGSHLRLQTPLMKHIALSELKLSRNNNAMQFSGKMTSRYQSNLHSVILHYQFLDANNKILGGGSEWIFDGVKAGQTVLFESKVSVSVPRAAKAVYSFDFDALELIK